MSTEPRDAQASADEPATTPATNQAGSEPVASPPTGDSAASPSAPVTSPTDAANEPVAPAAESATSDVAAETNSASETAAAVEPPAAEPVAATPTEAVSESQASAPTEAALAARAKIQVGSRRNKEEQAPTHSKPKVAGTEKPMAADLEAMDVAMPTTETLVPSKPVPKPSVRDELPADLQSEIDAALGGASIEQLIDNSGTDQSDDLEVDSRRRAFVLKVEGEHVFFSLGGPHEGTAALRQFKKPPTAGDPMEVIIAGYNTDEGIYELRIPGASISAADWSDIQEGAVVEARVSGSNTGGLECMVGGIRGFIPASQIEIFRVENFNDYIGKKLACVVTEAKPRKKNLVLSHRAIKEREREEEKKETMAKLAVGQIVEGRVSNIRDFGVFVDLGGVDGLIHISQLSWDHIKDPREVLKEGETVRVKIEKINAQTGKIGLGFRDLMEHPWEDVESKFPVNTVVRGPVTRIAKFGAFVKLGTGVEGLIHISEISHDRIASVGAVLREGQEVEVKVLSVDKEAQRIGLSMKATLPEPEKKEEAVEDEKPRELAVKPRKGPLKGGTRGKSGGEQFGLKW